MARFRILRLPDDRAEWLELFQRSASREVFAHPGYLELFCSSSVPYCAYFGNARCELMYPGLLRDLSREPFAALDTAFDIVAPPFGYGGPFLVSGEVDVESTKDFFVSYGDWARSRGIVSEYAVFSPKTAVLHYPGSVRVKAPCVVRTLHEPIDEIWMAYRSSLRRAVKAGQRNGVIVSVDQSGASGGAFLEIYSQTMERRGASHEYRLDQAFLDSLARSIPGHFAYAFAHIHGRPVSTELLLLSADSSFFFRGGTLEADLSTRANVVLKHEVILWSKARGLTTYVLGSGNAPDDSLMRYKRLFAPESEHVLHVGNWILDTERYSALVRARKQFESDAGRSWVPRGGYFPAYRAPPQDLA